MDPIPMTCLIHPVNQRREAAEIHFKRLNGTATSRLHGGTAADSLTRESAEKTPSRFEVYRADEVRMTSTRFCGGDWHWRLSDSEGLILLDTGGYASEHECLAAIGILQDHAGWASVSPAH